jgi:hypothetical protein
MYVCLSNDTIDSKAASEREQPEPEQSEDFSKDMQHESNIRGRGKTVHVVFK